MNSGNETAGRTERREPSDAGSKGSGPAPASGRVGGVLRKLIGPLRDRAVFEAASEGDEVALGRLLVRGGRAEAVGGPGMSALGVAAARGQAGAVRILLAHGADPSRRMAGEMTALHCAAMEAQVGTIEILLAAGADPNARGAEGETPLHLAAAERHPGAVEQLLAGGAEASAADRHGATPLHLALLSNPGTERVPTVQTVMALLAAGADPLAESLFFGSPLQVAAVRGYDACARELLDAALSSGRPFDAEWMATAAEEQGNYDLAEALRARVA